jgi:Leucine rich repeat
LANALNQRHGSHVAVVSPNLPSSPITPYPPPSASSVLASAFPFLGIGSRSVKPAKLTLTPHHLFYLLTRFQELGVSVGPMDIRLENIHTEASPANYVSFLNQAQRKKLRNSDRDSIHSVSSIRSVMSTMSSLWSRLGLSSNSESKLEKQKAAILDDMKYLYSAFTKVPCLRLSPDHKAPLIAGFEEFPFDSAVPLLAFKNVTVLEISDIDFRQFYGWDRMADQLRSLTVKRAGVEDPSDLLINIVLDDMDKRRRRSAKIPPSPILPWLAPSPVMKQAELVRSTSDASPPIRPLSMGSSGSMIYPSKNQHVRQRSVSPQRPSSSRHGSSQGHSRSGTPNLRRSSASSSSTDRANTPRGSSSNLLTYGFIPSSKWRFLRQLSLADNSLTTITALSLSPVASTLQYLDLSSNLFKEVPDCLNSLISLRALNLSYCMIDSLHSLSKNPLPAITTINLRGNRLSSLAGVERLLSLERIDIRENKLTDPTELARLTGIPGMLEVYVNRNPFTKTHTNYRVSIFNLFRATPGYMQDICIDNQSPSYSERKQLVDRAPEPPIIPIVKRQVVYPSVQSPQPVGLGSETPILYDAFFDKFESLGHSRKRSEHGRGSQRRKKGTRRRVVPIVQEDTVDAQPITNETSSYLPKESVASVTTDDSTYGGSVDATPTRPYGESEAEQIVERDARESSQVVEEATQSLVNVVPQKNSIESASSLSSSSSSSSSDTPKELPSQGELYKKHIEGLRSDFGNSWLSALTDETWNTGHQSPPTAFTSPFTPASPLSPPAGPMRVASQPIVSTGRTLG